MKRISAEPCALEYTAMYVYIRTFISAFAYVHKELEMKLAEL